MATTTVSKVSKDFPKSQSDFYNKFSSDQAALRWLSKVRWQKGFVCPHCSGLAAWDLDYGSKRCSACDKRVAPLSATLFHKQKLGPRHLLEVAWLMTWNKSGVSATALSNSLGVAYPTAWLALHRFREVMHEVSNKTTLSGEVEIDETFLGGSKGVANKHCVFVFVEKGPGGLIRLETVPSATIKRVNDLVPKIVLSSSIIHTDANNIYKHLDQMGYEHRVYNISNLPDEAHKYLPSIHSAAANLKSWFLGTLHRTPTDKHINYYLSEYAYRFNSRNLAKGELFYELVKASLEHSSIKQSDIIAR